MTSLSSNVAGLEAVGREELLAVEGGLNVGMLPLAVVEVVRRLLAKLQ
jgi:hypothetical protein